MLRILLFIIITSFLKSCNQFVQGIPQWKPYEVNLAAAYDHHFLDFPVQVTFTHEKSGNQLVLDAYWNGKNSWQVRFAPIRAGKWNWTSTSADPGLGDKSGEILCVEPTVNQIEKNPNLRGKVKVKPGSRIFTYADDTPVLLLAEQFWDFNVSSWITVYDSLPNNINTYLKDRSSKGFNVVQMRFMRPSRKNEGGYPFPGNTEKPGNGNFDSMNVEYFQYLDERFKRCFEQGFIIAGHPEWIGADLNISLEDAQKLERYFLARYGAFNLIYSLSGEFDKNFHHEHRDKLWVKGRWNDINSDTINMQHDPEPWRQLGIYVGQYNVYNTPLSIHSGWHQPERSSSGDYLQDQDWFDHSWIQTYKDVYAVPEAVRKDYDRKPVKPVFFSEGIREGDQTQEAGINEYGIRWEAWQSLLSGAAAHTYRHFGVYMDKFYTDNKVGLWTENLSAKGSSQVGLAVNFFRNLDWTDLKPAHEFIRVNSEIPPFPESSTREQLNKMVNLAADPGNLYIVYIPMNSLGKDISIRSIKENVYRVRWFNPSNGTFSDVNNGNPVKIDDNGEWIIPVRPDNKDWVILLTASNKDLAI